MLEPTLLKMNTVFIYLNAFITLAIIYLLKSVFNPIL